MSRPEPQTLARTKPVKPWDYQRLLWNGSGLTSGETLVAQYLAWKSRADADADGWFTVSQADIGKATKIRKRDTVAQRLQSLIEKGWAQCYRPVVEGKYQTTRYRITQPVRAPKTGHGSTQKRDTVHAPKMGQDMPQKRGNEVRSYFTDGVGHGAPPGGDGNDDNETQAPPAPALPGGRTGDAGTEAVTDERVWALIDAERRSRQEADLANQRRHLTTGDYLAVTCRDCNAAPGADCRELPAPRPRLRPALGDRPRLHTSRAIAARAVGAA